MSEDTAPLHPSHRMLSWLSDVCTEAREEAGVSRERVADIGGMSADKVKRFERDADRWPRDPDLLLAAYATAVGLKDHREFWLRAIERSMRHGQPLVMVDGRVADGAGRVPKAALRAMEEAIDAYVRELEPAKTRAARASSGARRRAASAPRARP